MTSIADKLGFGPKREVKNIGDETSGDLWEISVTPPAFMNLPTRKVVLMGRQYKGYLEWLNGGMIQDCLPDLSPSNREILMTGLGDEDFHEIAKSLAVDDDECDIVNGDDREPEGGWDNYNENHPDWGKY